MKTKIFFLCFGALWLTNLSILVAPTNSAAASGPSGKTKPCFQCKGAGKTPCTVASCVGGKANCPAPCLKLSDAGWIHMEVAGHPPTDLWRKFPKKGGGYQAWSQKHVGEVVTMKNGEPTNMGKCSTCGGTTKVKCGTCKGTGEVQCNLCDGRKIVPESWSAFDNPKLKSRPTHFKMKDGSVIVGRKTMVLGSQVTIKTEKDSVTVLAADIVSEETPSPQK